MLVLLVLVMLVLGIKLILHVDSQVTEVERVGVGTSFEYIAAVWVRLCTKWDKLYHRPKVRFWVNDKLDLILGTIVDTFFRQIIY
jgi:hypothetical protein